MNERRCVGVLIALLCVFGSPDAEAQEWAHCATEGGVCAFSGTMDVRYGANGAFAIRTLTGGAACTNTVFGDPVYGVVKRCEIKADEQPLTMQDVVIVDSTNRAIGPLHTAGSTSANTVLVFLDGTFVHDWFGGDAAQRANQWVYIEVTPGGFRNSSYATLHVEANCDGQPYILKFSGDWFQRAALDARTGLGILGDETIVLLEIRSFKNHTTNVCTNEATTTMSVARAVSFSIADLGFAPPFRAEVISR